MALLQTHDHRFRLLFADPRRSPPSSAAPANWRIRARRHWAAGGGRRPLPVAGSDRSYQDRTYG